MGIYRSICYKIEDLLLKVIIKKADQAIAREKVNKYRMEKEVAREPRSIELGK